MQEQAALLPGSQAGEEGTSVWSHGAHRFPVTSTSAHPPHLLLSTLYTSLSLSLSFFFLYRSYVIEFFFLTSSHLCLPYASHTGPHRFTLWKIKKPTADYLFAGAGRTHTHTQTNTLRFLTGGRMFPRSKGYFYMSLTWFDSKKHSFYIYRLCLSPGVEKGCGSCI